VMVETMESTAKTDRLRTGDMSSLLAPFRSQDSELGLQVESQGKRDGGFICPFI
jgi:hypothetical protein